MTSIMRLAGFCFLLRLLDVATAADSACSEGEVCSPDGVDSGDPWAELQASALGGALMQTRRNALRKSFAALEEAEGSTTSSCHIPSPGEALTLPMELNTSFVELPGPPNTRCPEGVGNGVCSGSLTFSFSCAEAAEVRFKVMVYTPDTQSDSFYIGLDDEASATNGWGLGLRNKWTWTHNSPRLQASAGTHTLILRGREDGIRVMEVKIGSDNTSSCTFLPNLGGERLKVVAAVQGTTSGNFVKTSYLPQHSLWCDGVPTEIGAGMDIPAGTKCNTACAAGFTASVSEVSCGADGILTSEAFTCVADPCKEPSKWLAYVNTTHRCAEADADGFIQSGQICTTQCREGYSPTVSSLSCNAGLRWPLEYTCYESDCPAPQGIANVHPAGACEEGSSIESRDDCTAQCADGYLPSKHHLDCRRGVLSPANFTCEPTWPEMPLETSTSGGWCVKYGRWEWSGSSNHAIELDCQNWCSDYERCHFYCFSDAQPAERRCQAYERCSSSTAVSGNGVDVSMYKCYHEPEVLPCTVPDALAPSPGSPPAAGAVDTTPTFVELRGPYEVGCRNAWSVSSCSGAVEFYFQCPSATTVSFSVEIAAQDGHADSMSVQVDEGDTPSWHFGPSPNMLFTWETNSPSFDVGAGEHRVYFRGREDGIRFRTLKIHDSNSVCSLAPSNQPQQLTISALRGELSGFFIPSYEALPPVLVCDGETLELGSGSSIAHGAKCWPQCPFGYTMPEEERALECVNGGMLTPSTFSCSGIPCKVPSGIDFAWGEPCMEQSGGVVPHNSNCTPRCLPGFTPTLSGLKCTTGALEPQTFECHESVCVAPEVDNTGAGGTCKEGSIIDSRGKCTPNCAEGFYPSQVELSCMRGELTPESFTCDSEPHWKIEEQLCKRQCPDRDWNCHSDCYKLWVPPEIQEQVQWCQWECNVEYWEDDSDRRGSCSQPCRSLETARFEAEGFTYPDWLHDYIMCTREPPSGCQFLPGGSERNNCYGDCQKATPTAMRIYRQECIDACEENVPAEATVKSEIDRNKYSCMNLCWKVAAERQMAEDEAKGLLGNVTGDAGACAEAGQALALEILQAKDEISSRVDAVMSDVRQALTGLMQAQWMAEESTRMAGGSGVTKVRTLTSGSQPYHSGSYTSPALMSMHNHANGWKTVGLGEFAAVVNGVSFRTRHNDYSLKMPHRTDSGYHATEHIPRPPVPPSVASLPDVDAQIQEMRTYFKAFKEQNVSLRDYRPYFKPILCYMETGWEKLDADDLAEPFESDRHHIAATGWKDLVEKVRFFDLSGGKDTLENIPWLPTAVFEMDIVDGRLESRLAKWGYRILCHPIDGDVETARIHLVQDALVRMHRQNRFRMEEEAFLARDARFRIDPRLPLDQVKKDPEAEVQMGRNYLDLLMEQIPGKNNYPADLRDDITHPTTVRLEPYLPGDADRPTKGTAINAQHESGELNTGYYSRYFSGSLDAMGRSNQRRGFNDPFLWAAMTTHERMANISMIDSGSRIRPGQVCLVPGTSDPCPRVSQRWTYATPVELIYLTPLFEWNPYNLPTVESGADATGNGQAESPLSAAIKRDTFYRTPAGFFGSCAAGLSEPPDSADTDREALWVLDGGGVARQVVASGQQIVTRCIPGVGKLRLRYNIMPIHEEGATTYKEVKALEKLIEERLVPAATAGEAPPTPPPFMELILTGGAADHQHEVVIESTLLQQLEQGETVWATSAFVEGHVHTIEITAVANPDDTSDHAYTFSLGKCNTGSNQMDDKCVDGHNDLAIDFIQGSR